jgi:hypothetical protein
MLVQPNPDGSLQQGDVIRDVPFVVLPSLLNVKADGVKGQARIDCQDPATFEKVKGFAGGKQLTATQVPIVVAPGLDPYPDLRH